MKAYIAARVGLVGILAAEVTEGPDQGLPLGIAWALDEARRS